MEETEQPFVGRLRGLVIKQTVRHSGHETDSDGFHVGNNDGINKHAQADGPMRLRQTISHPALRGRFNQAPFMTFVTS
jgi:hypothetical protein